MIKNVEEKAYDCDENKKEAQHTSLLQQNTSTPFLKEVKDLVVEEIVYLRRDFSTRSEWE